MIYIVVNGVLVEAETVTEVHFQMDVKKYHTRYPQHETVKSDKIEENSILTEITREIFNEIKKRELK